MGVQEALRHHFDEFLSYWSYSFGTLPKIPYDVAANPMLYQSEPNEEDYFLDPFRHIQIGFISPENAALRHSDMT
ncbi:hypothetical protein ABEX25_01795 [Paenibacillus thiaminolyticus]|uniref:hypothetical protein n=1 Tax=Paenibacillus thiaminolyticus TaxID=49283 RepID=UPI003D2E9063